LVKHIRAHYGDTFCIGVAGYPEGHPTKMTLVEDGIDSLTDAEKARYSIDKSDDGHDIILVCKDKDFEAELDYLQRKVEAGASFIVTQMFFDVDVFFNFVRACRQRGITVPIIPGIMCISNYNGFKKMAKFCKTRVPILLAEGMEATKDNEAEVKEFGFTFIVDMCKNLLHRAVEGISEECKVAGLHFYTLNPSALTIRIMDALGLVDNKSITATAVDAVPETVFEVVSAAVIASTV